MTPAHTEALAGLPLQTLRVFDAAARHLNMVRAAAELGMTQGAVSRQVKALEESLREQLFRRGPRGLALTEAGDVLAEYVARGFGELATGLRRIGQPRRRTTLIVSASRTFALRVLAPRLGDFARLHPWIDLRVDGHRYYANLQRTDADLSIRLGDGRWRGGRVVPLLPREPLFPVCAPTLWQAAVAAGAAGPAVPRAVSPAEFLRRHVLLHYVERPYWAAWLRAAGLEDIVGHQGDGTGPCFDETALALAAAEAGQGVAVARRAQVADALAAGRLVRPFATDLDDGLGYFLVTTEAGAEKSNVQAFIRWLRARLAATAESDAAVDGG
jgi:DNA-binding transcriptional LysR family regulator